MKRQDLMTLARKISQNLGLVSAMAALSGCLPTEGSFNTIASQQASSSSVGTPVIVTPTPASTPQTVATPPTTISVPAPTPTPTPTEPPRASNSANKVMCANGTKLPGIDVSDYEAGTNWTEVEHGGVGFTFIKATEGTNFTNKYYATDWPASKAAGVVRGAYHFFHPGDDPTVQAQYFLKTIGTLGSADMPAMLDWEVTDGVSSATQIANARIWLNLVEAATGKIPVIYVSPSFWNELGNPQGFDRYPLYIANYDVSCPDIPPPWNSWVFWQTGNGPAAGVQTSDADLDVFNGTTAELLQFATTGAHQ